MAHSTLTATASLLHNNLTDSTGGWLACVHNSVNIGGGKLMLHNLPTGQSKDGPEANQATSIRFLELQSGCSVLCVSSTSGTQIYNEDATTLLFYAPLSDTAGSPEVHKCHQAACIVTNLQQIVIGTSKGSLVLVQAADHDKFTPLPEANPASATTEVADVCFSPLANVVVSAHSNGELRTWQPSARFVNDTVVPGFGQAPVRIASFGCRLLVAYGPGTICLFDAMTRELQVEISAHARWITGIATREELGQFASVGEDTALNVWQVDHDTGRVNLTHSSVVADKLLTGVAFHGELISVTAYDTDELYKIPLGSM